jgi:hypothetical protein
MAEVIKFSKSGRLVFLKFTILHKKKFTFLRRSKISGKYIECCLTSVYIKKQCSEVPINNTKACDFCTVASTQNAWQNSKIIIQRHNTPCLYRKYRFIRVILDTSNWKTNLTFPII